MSFKDGVEGEGLFESRFGAGLIRNRRRFIVGSQLLLVVVGYFLSFVLRYGSFIDSYGITFFWLTVPWLLGIKAVVFYYFDLYRGWWRYVGMNDLMDILRAATVSTLIFIFLAVFLFPSFPRSVFLIDWFVTIVFIGGIRFMLRALREKFVRGPDSAVRNVLIYGGHSIGVELLKEIRSNPSLSLNVVGFIDDFAPKKGFKIHGVSILGGREDIPKIIERYEVNEIIITTPSLRPRELKDLVVRFKEANVRFKIVPPMSDIINERVSLKQLRDVSVEDLLGRKAVHLDEDLIRASLAGKTVMITGAGGSIGSELARQAALNDPETIVLFERNENALFMIDWEISTHFPQIRVAPIVGDVVDEKGLCLIMEKYKPATVYHAAAYKHVPMMELHPLQAIRNNILGADNMARAAVRYGVERFVFVSTDKAVRPTNTMGMTKRVGEIIVQTQSRKSPVTKFLAVRFGNVMGSAGSVIPLFQRQIEEGGPVTVTHPKAERYFMTIPEAVQLVMQAAAMGEGGEIFVLEMGEPINILELAKNVISLSGLEADKDIEIKFIGLRPGEKMSEELFHSPEEIVPTAHNKIHVVPNSADKLPQDTESRLSQLIEWAHAGETEKILASMRIMTDGSAPPEVEIPQQSSDVAIPMFRSKA